MSDKRTTLDEAVSSIESGMTIGVGGWGSRRKPMAFVRALLRTGVKDLTVVTYGGPDIGLLCSADKVKRVYYGFVSLDSPPFYDPWFAKARTGGSVEAREMDEGMLRCGLQAAAQRLPFLPIRAGLGSDVRTFWGDELKTVRSPYPTDGGFEELIAMPPLRLDAAFVHMNIGDAQGNGAYTGIAGWFGVSGSVPTTYRAAGSAAPSTAADPDSIDAEDHGAVANHLCSLASSAGIECAVTGQVGRHDWSTAASVFAAALPWLAGRLGTPTVAATALPGAPAPL